MATWSELEQADAGVALAARKLLMNCSSTWGIALLGTLRRDGSPRIAPLCVYILDGALFITVESHKERDLRRDPRCSLHSYWGDGQDEFAIAGVASAALDRVRRERLVDLEPRLRHSPSIREVEIAMAHSVVYKNFPRADMYAEVAVWRPGATTRRWERAEPVPDEDLNPVTGRD